jgi:hypothetical protein
VTVLLFGLTFVGQDDAQPAADACTEWNLAADFRVFPDQENPSRDCCGHPGVWHYLESDPNTFPAHLPSTYRLLQEFIRDAFFISGLEQWQGSVVSISAKDKLPAVGINNTGGAQVFARWLPGVIRVHPLHNKLVIVGWRSPMTGTVMVSGGVSDIDPSGGNGILWSIDHFDGVTNRTVASGSIPEGGSQSFQDGSGGAGLVDIPVDEGDFLYFLVDPKSGSHGFDSTGLSVAIRGRGGVCTEGPCDDCDACTHTDTCAGGVCSGTAYGCDDGNVCTTDACDGAGGCGFTNNTLECDDGNACTVSDRCSGGVCQGMPACDDGNVCTVDTCDPEIGCSFDPTPGAPCSDGNACTVGDTCASGSAGGAFCQAGPSVACDDRTACTTDSCDPSTGGCVYNPLNCDDGNVCTLDSCDALGGCVYVRAPVPPAGRTITVDDDGPSQFRSIQAAIDDPNTAAGDVVSVGPGTYAENIAVKCGVSVVGAEYETTIVDGGGRGAVARIFDCCSDTRLQGLTLTNGYVSGGSGAGVQVVGGAPIITSNLIAGNRAEATFAGGYYYCYGFSPGSGGGVSLVNSQATVSHNRITNNSGQPEGGGIWVYRGSPVITRNVITGNQAVVAASYTSCYTSDFAGGVSVLDSTATVSENVIADNTATAAGGIAVIGGSPLVTRNEISANEAVYNGGGLFVNSAGMVMVVNNLIVANRVLIEGGGGVASFGDRTSIANNTIAGNIAGDVGGGVLLGGSQATFVNNVVYRNQVYGDQGGGIYVFRPTAAIANNIFFLNLPDSCQGSGSALCSGSGNLAADPLLANPSGGDYRLSAGSPAIDSGQPASAPSDDFRGQRRPLDGDFDGVPGVDRGAYEYDRDDVLGLRFVSDSLINWDAAPGATSYHVYSGFLDTVLTSGLDACRDGEDAVLSDLAFTETRIPATGEGFAYLVTAVVGGVEGSPGWNSLGLERPQPIHCP